MTIRSAKETMSANVPTQKSRYLIMREAINFMKIPGKPQKFTLDSIKLTRS